MPRTVKQRKEASCPDKPGVMILYNLPRDTPSGSEALPWIESESGVLDEVEMVREGLQGLGVPYRIVGIRRLTELSEILAESPEQIIFNLVEGLEGDVANAWFVPAICSSFGKSATGCDTLCQIIATDKWQAKAVFKAAGLPCPKGVLVQVGEVLGRLHPASGPFIVKPAFTDAGEGIDAESVVKEPGPALHAAVRRVHEQFKQPALVEQFVGSRELNVAAWEHDGKVEVLPIAEMEFHGFGPDRPKIMDYRSKWVEDTFEYENTRRKIPADLTRQQVRKVEQCVLGAWNATGCTDYARVDLRLDDRGWPVIIEVNPNPDISPEAGFMAGMEAKGLTRADFAQAMLDNATRRLVAAGVQPAAKHAVKAKKVRYQFRRIEAGDAEPIIALLHDTGNFRLDEIEVAQEVLDSSIAGGEAGHYQSLVVDGKNGAAGWVCFGPTPCTVGTFDIYWLAVARELQSQGMGTALLAKAEKMIVRKGGRMAVIETSGMDKYRAARRVYNKVGYEEASRIWDFYAPGDHKIIFTKRLGNR